MNKYKKEPPRRLEREREEEEEVEGNKEQGLHLIAVVLPSRPFAIKNPTRPSQLLLALPSSLLPLGTTSSSFWRSPPIPSPDILRCASVTRM
ncbi:hypothetical protein M0802_005032 [Mischocyttarus mexicanus]|nr:hypothetical protein M0802_005032 [Mischocyttarus mexicanus]